MLRFVCAVLVGAVSGGLTYALSEEDLVVGTMTLSPAVLAGIVFVVVVALFYIRELWLIVVDSD